MFVLTPVYQRLIRQNIEDALQRAYPITFHLLKGDSWKKSIDLFLETTPLTSPFLWKMPHAFVSFIKEKELTTHLSIPYLDDLVHFEWLEIEIEMMPDIALKNLSHEGDLLNDLLHLNPENSLITYSYPVFEKKRIPRPMGKGIYPLFAFRHPKDHAARFISLSPFFATVIELLIKEPLTGKQALLIAAAPLKLDKDRVLDQGKKFLSELLKEGGICGFTNLPHEEGGVIR